MTDHPDGHGCDLRSILVCNGLLIGQTAAPTLGAKKTGRLWITYDDLERPLLSITAAPAATAIDAKSRIPP